MRRKIGRLELNMEHIISENNENNWYFSSNMKLTCDLNENTITPTLFCVAAQTVMSKNILHLAE
jgi:hypothetical protein